MDLKNLRVTDVTKEREFHEGVGLRRRGVAVGRAMLLRRAAAASATTLVTVQGYRFLNQDRSETHTLSTALQQFASFDVLRVISGRARQKHDEDCKEFARVQAEVLRTRLAANAATAYGRDHGFEHLVADGGDCVSAFREKHPITWPSHYEAYVERVAAGEAGVMNAEPETMLAATSGTSGKRNLLPNTPTMSSTFFTRGILVIFDTLRQSCPECFTLQKTCKLAFAPSWTESAGGLRIGPNSSGPKDKSFRRLLHLYSTPAEGYDISHDEYAALYVHALFAARDANLGIIEANFISLPARMLALIHRDGAPRPHGSTTQRLALAALRGGAVIHACCSSLWRVCTAVCVLPGAAIADDLESGSIGAAVAARLAPETLDALNARLGGPNPSRARMVRAALAGEEAAAAAGPADAASSSLHAEGAPDAARHGLARRLWPKLKLFLANGTGAFASYAERLQKGEGAGVPILSTVLAASEGLMGISLDPKHDGSASYCLVPRAMFFEFLPVVAPGGAPAVAAPGAGNAAASAPPPTDPAARYGGTLLPHELTVGEDYEVVITNLGGRTCPHASHAVPEPLATTALVCTLLLTVGVCARLCATAGLYRYRVGDVVRIAQPPSRPLACAYTLFPLPMPALATACPLLTLFGVHTTVCLVHRCASPASITARRSSISVTASARCSTCAARSSPSHSSRVACARRCRRGGRTSTR